MKRINRFIAAAVAGVLMLSGAACSNGSQNDYPVKLAGQQFSETPKKVVCLSDNIADILIACGYGESIAAKTDECNQPELENVPSVGSRENPSYARIESIAPDVVFSDKTVSQEIVKKLGSNNYSVLNMIHAESGKELSVLYSSVSAVMEGEIKGRQNGEKKASSLLQTFDAMERAIPAAGDDGAAQPTACYLYDVNGTAATNDSFCGKYFKYAKALNVCATSETSMGSVESIRISNPDFIFCATGVKDQILKSEKFKDLDAVKNGKIYEIDANEFARQGDTMTEVLSFMIKTMYPELQSKTESEQTSEPSKQESKKEESKQESKKEESKKQESKKQESEPKTIVVKADNSLKITDDTAFGQGDENDDIKKIQKRLKDLGYGEFEEGITNYFGEMTAEAFKAFQKNNGLDPDGYAGADALRLLFSDKVKPATVSGSESSKQQENQ